MNKLLKADFVRLKIGSIFYIILLSSIFVSAISTYSNRIFLDDDALKNCLELCAFNFIYVMYFLIIVFCSLFIGVNFSDGTIRNKICVGRKRTEIYLSTFITCMFAGCMFYIVAFITSCIEGTQFVGKFGISTDKVVIMFLTGMCICISITSLVTFVSMTLCNRTYTIIACLLVYVMASAQVESMAIAIDSYNTSETTKSIYKFILNLIPSGQIYKFAELETNGTAMLYSLLFTAILLIGGIVIFNKRNIK